eukprot:757847-Hanusia_phi.AAC.3
MECAFVVTLGSLALTVLQEKDLNNDGGILISYNQKDHIDAAMGWRHPDVNDDVSNRSLSRPAGLT